MWWQHRRYPQKTYRETLTNAARPLIRLYFLAYCLPALSKQKNDILLMKWMKDAVHALELLGDWRTELKVLRKLMEPAYEAHLTKKEIYTERKRKRKLDLQEMNEKMKAMARRFSP